MSSSSTDALAAFTLFFSSFGFMCCFFVLLFGILIIGTIFWIFMLIDANKREWKDRQTWILILAISFVLGIHYITAIVYYFAVKKPNLGTLRN